LALVAGAGACGDRALEALESRLCEAGPIDENQLRWLGPDGRSHWLQPWRAWRDTWPAARMRDAPLFGLAHTTTTIEEGDRRAAMLAAAGIRRMGLGFGWNVMDYADPARLSAADRDRLRRWVGVLRKHDLRPLMLLDAYHGAPVPARAYEARVLAPAPAGARTLVLDAGSASEVVLNKTGIDLPDAGSAASRASNTPTRSRTSSICRPAMRTRCRRIRTVPRVFPRAARSRPSSSSASCKSQTPS
jgi:hypothetical protein